MTELFNSFKESEHPRDKAGKFTSGGGVSGVKEYPKGFMPFLEIAKKTQEIDTFMAEAAKVKGVPYSVSSWFKDEFSEGDDLASMKDVVGNFLKDFHGESGAYETAKARKKDLNDWLDEAGGEISRLTDGKKGNMGLLPESVRQSPEYRKAKSEFDAREKKVKAFNQFFSKTFKKEDLKFRRENPRYPQKASEKTNAKEYPKFYYARHMKEGVCGYGDETVLLRDDVIKSMTQSFNGKPVYVYHDDRTESERIATLEETADGYVTDSFYNEQDGWFWVKMMVTTEKGHKAVANGWAVSNAYIPTQDKQGGTKHNVPYNREITEAYYTHLAIVDNPRYEEAKIFTPEEYKHYQDEKRQQLNELKNSTEEPKGIIMKFFKKTKEEVSVVDADTFVELTNDDGSKSEVKVSEMIEAVSAEKQNDVAEPDMDAMVELEDGEKVKLKELINSYEAKKKKDAEKENECDEDELENESDEDEKENEADEGEKDDEGEKQNHIDELKNAHKTSPAPRTEVFTRFDGLALGKSKY